MSIKTELSKNNLELSFADRETRSPHRGLGERCHLPGFMTLYLNHERMRATLGQ